MMNNSLRKLNAQLEALKSMDTSNALLAGSYKLQRYAMQNSPIDTGANKNSAQSEVVDEHAEMSFNMEYSLYLEEGTEKMEGRHYIQKAIDEHEKDIVKAVQKQIEKDMRDSI
jgi:HK97 gp10 family phage protein